MLELDPQKLAQSHVVIGAMGSIVALRFAPGASWLERAGNVFAGSLCASYLTPAAGHWMGVDSVGALGALAFLIGLFGLSMTSALLQALRELRLAEIIGGWISRKG